MKYFGSLIVILLLSCFLITCATEQKEIQAMTFNIRYDNPNDGQNAWDKRKIHVGNQIIEYLPDFLGIQEGMVHQISYLSEHLESYKVIGVSREGVGIPGEFCSLFYNTKNYELISENTFWLSDTPNIPSKGWDASYKRICTYGQFHSKNLNETIWVFNTHFDHMGVEARMESAKLLHSKINELTNQTDAIILMGDLNALPNSAPIAFLKTYYDDPEIKLQKIDLEPIGTFNGFDPDLLVTSKLDYIFSKNLFVSNYKHINVLLSDSTFISDHLPVIATFKFK